MSCDPVQTWADPCLFGVESGTNTSLLAYCQPVCITHDCKASECIVRMRAERDALLKAAKALYGCRAEDVAMRWDALTKAIQAAECQESP